MDVARVLAAILLLGNIKFDDTDTEKSDFGEGDAKSFKKEIHAVASLLGVSSANLYKGFTIRTSCSKGQIIKSRRHTDSVSLFDFT